jgi:hypothetical protein
MRKATIPAATRATVFAKHDSCVACGTWDADECGHLIAESNGGSVDAVNLVRLCSACNRAQASANVVFGTFATFSLEPALVTSRRAYWAKYCGAARGTVKVKAYRAAA